MVVKNKVFHKFLGANENARCRSSMNFYPVKLKECLAFFDGMGYNG